MMLEVKYENETDMVDLGMNDGTVWFEKNGRRVSWSEYDLLPDQDKEALKRLETRLMAHTKELQEFMRSKAEAWQIVRDEQMEKKGDTIEYFR